MASTFKRTLQFDGLKIQNVSVSVTIEVHKDFADAEDPIVTIQVSVPDTGTSVSIVGSDLHDLFDVTEQSGLLAAQPAAELGFSSLECSVTIGDFTVTGAGLNWGSLGLVTNPQDSVALLRQIKDLAHEAASMPVPVRRA